MRKQNWILIGLLALFASCLEEDDEEVADLEAPSISAMAGTSSVQPEHFFEVDVETENVPLAFTMEDATGIREIKMDVHSGFDGHTHGKSAFAKNAKFILFNHNEVIESTRIENPNRFSYESEIFLDERNPTIDEDDLILAGPYHFSIQATDLEGNETTYRDDTTYHTTLYINRPYAPQVELTALDASANSVEGRIFRNMDHEASSDITFLWMYIEAPSERPNQEGTVITERLWGESNWPHQFRSNQGEPLPDARELDIAELIGGDADFLESLGSNKLVIWAEDANGNISVNRFNN